MTQTLDKHNLTPETKLQVHAAHKAHWYKLDNIVFDRYGTAIGADGLGVYAGLARYAHNETAQCYPSAAHLAKKLGTTVDHIATCLARLEGVGLIHVQIRGGSCPLITLLEPERSGPPVVLPPETVHVPDFTLATSSVEIEKTVPMTEPYKEDQEKDLIPSQEEEREEAQSFATLGREEGEETDTESYAPAPVMHTASLVVPDPAAVSPHALPEETKEALCESGYHYVRQLQAAVWKTEARRLALEETPSGCMHPTRNETGTACTVCYEVLEPAVAD